MSASRQMPALTGDDAVAPPLPELLLVARLHVDLLRVASACCRRER